MDGEINMDMIIEEYNSLGKTARGLYKERMELLRDRYKINKKIEELERRIKHIQEIEVEMYDGIKDSIYYTEKAQEDIDTIYMQLFRYGGLMDIKEINKKLKELRKQRPIDFHAINELEYQKLKIKQKEKKGKKKTKTQLENELFKKKVAKADEIFSKYIRLRDTKGKKIKCITFINHRDGEKIWIQFHGSHCCHWISRGYWSCRWEEWNCFAGCGYCNTYDQENHHNQLTAIQVKTHGIDWVEKQLREKNKVKPTLDKLDKIIEEFSKKYKDLCEKYKFKG